MVGALSTKYPDKVPKFMAYQALTHSQVYNAMSGGLHVKEYYQENGLCAKVPLHLCVFGPLKDNDLTQMIDAICTN